MFDAGHMLELVNENRRPDGLFMAGAGGFLNLLFHAACCVVTLLREE